MCYFIAPLRWDYFLAQYPNEKILSGELGRLGLGLIPTAANMTYGVIELLVNQNFSQAAVDLGWAFGGLEIMWLALGLWDFCSPSAYGEHLRKTIIHGSLDEKLSELYPHKFVSYLAAPYIANKLWYKEVVKGNN